MDDNKLNSTREITKFSKFYSPQGEELWTFLFSRKNAVNEDDIAHCAALAFHKSLIGISELSLLEKSSVSLRLSKAVQTYYAVYHLFVCAMLLDENYDIIFGSKERQNYEVDKEDLSSRSETPEQWNRGKFLEADLASSIQHADIRRYCKECRNSVEKKKKLNSRTKVLYDAFVYSDGKTNTKCIPGLYEKLDYIRDRAIYRPTYVIRTDGSPAQTSYDVRVEIESMPKADDIFASVESFFEAVYKDRATNLILQLFVSYVQGGAQINQKAKILNRLNYSWESLEKMGGSKCEQTVPSYLCQMMELFNEEDAVAYYEKYWKKIVDYSGEEEK